MSLIATRDGVRLFATIDGPRRASCLQCGDDMIAKTGEVVTHHWAHAHQTDCPGSHETAWHMEWKATCPDADRIEVTVGNRRADVLTRYGWSIEFQHSSQSNKDVRAREADWGQRIIWCFDETASASRETRYDTATGQTRNQLEWWHPPDRPFETIRWSHAKAYIFQTAAPTFLHIDADRLLYVGLLHEAEGPKFGYGWLISREDFVAHVVNGQRPPVPPLFGAALEPAAWSVPFGDQEPPYRVVDGHRLNDWPACACGRAIYYHPRTRTACQHCEPVPLVRNGAPETEVA